MPSFAAVSRERHGDKRWLSFGSDFRFAAQTAVAPLVAAELPKAMMAFPIGFILTEDVLNPVAILSLEPNRNLFIADDGRWIGNYQPSIFRSFPFRLIPSKGDKLTLCVDEESGLITTGPEGEPFFEGDEVGPRLKQVMDFLTYIEQAKIPTGRACAALNRHGVIKPWTITVKAEEGDKRVNGLLQIDEAALNALPIEAFDDLRQSGALMMAYCQLLSMQHLPILGRLADAHAAQRKEVETIMKQSFRPAEANEIDIDWASFSDDSPEKGTT